MGWHSARCFPQRSRNCTQNPRPGWSGMMCVTWHQMSTCCSARDCDLPYEGDCSSQPNLLAALERGFGISYRQGLDNTFVSKRGMPMGRRGHDEGSIYQRESDAKWVAAVNLGYGPDGKRKRKVFYG